MHTLLYYPGSSSLLTYIVDSCKFELKLHELLACYQLKTYTLVEIWHLVIVH